MTVGPPHAPHPPSLPTKVITSSACDLRVSRSAWRSSSAAIAFVGPTHLPNWPRHWPHSIASPPVTSPEPLACGGVRPEPPSRAVGGPPRPDIIAPANSGQTSKSSHRRCHSRWGLVPAAVRRQPNPGALHVVQTAKPHLRQPRHQSHHWSPGNRVGWPTGVPPSHQLQPGVGLPCRPYVWPHPDQLLCAVQPQRIGAQEPVHKADLRAFIGAAPSRCVVSHGHGDVPNGDRDPDVWMSCDRVKGTPRGIAPR